MNVQPAILHRGMDSPLDILLIKNVHSCTGNFTIFTISQSKSCLTHASSAHWTGFPSLFIISWGKQNTAEFNSPIVMLKFLSVTFDDQWCTIPVWWRQLLDDASLSSHVGTLHTSYRNLSGTSSAPYRQH